MSEKQKKYGKAIVIGGGNGIGLAIVMELSSICESVSIVDRTEPGAALPANVTSSRFNLLNGVPDFSAQTEDTDILVITAGFGRIAPFQTFTQAEIENVFRVNTIALTKVINQFYARMMQKRPFYCAVMGSIAGLISSPMISLYSASKAAICRLVEGLNIELESAGTDNRILDVAPGSIKGTRFTGSDRTDLSQLETLASDIISNMLSRQTVYIPDYETIYKGVIARYHADPHAFGIQSCRYKIEGGRMNEHPQVRVGYLSGTFDLFHVGHLNLLRRAKEYCDYLVVGVHRDASHKGKQAFIPFEERCEIVRNVRFVDQVIPSLPEDDEVYRSGIVKYDYLFVGSDYKGTERFNRYEEYFSDKGVRIIYFPYTDGTSSTQLRDALESASGKK
ncbi:MAG: SDR family NAD(P)-dependent oxidoreductase [Bacteroidaceae bacterium]|nr:SDR family NAD(P)-dependent oxidoreductase [Bacteroidaceae bacterium]